MRSLALVATVVMAVGIGVGVMVSSMRMEGKHELAFIPVTIATLGHHGVTSIGMTSGIRDTVLVLGTNSDSVFLSIMNEAIQVRVVGIAVINTNSGSTHYMSAMVDNHAAMRIEFTVDTPSGINAPKLFLGCFMEITLRKADNFSDTDSIGSDTPVHVITNVRDEKPILEVVI